MIHPLAERIPLMLRAAAGSLLWWVSAVLLASIAGYPGVLCATPMAWLLALPAAHRYTSRMVGREDQWLLLEAAAVGGLVGLAEAVIYAAAIPLAFSIAPDEEANVALLTLMIGGGGIVAGAFLGFVMALLVRRRA